jgi:hypothetical protein
MGRSKRKKRERYSHGELLTVPECLELDVTLAVPAKDDEWRSKRQAIDH